MDFFFISGEVDNKEETLSFNAGKEHAMQIPIVIEPIGDGQIPTHSFPPFTAVAEGRTSEEAIAKVRGKVTKKKK